MAPPKKCQKPPPEKKHKCRGASLMKSITKGVGHGERLAIQLNTKNQVIGPNKSKLSTYIGTTAKKWVPITIPNWKLVSKEEKDMIWDDVVETWKIPKEEVVVKDQESGDLQKDATCPSHYEHQNHERVAIPDQFIYEIPSLLDPSNFADCTVQASFQFLSRADPSHADGYTRMLRGEQEEGVIESESTTPSMQPVVDTSLPISTAHNSKVSNSIPPTTSDQTTVTFDTYSRADPSPADGYTITRERMLRGEQEKGVSESDISTTHNSKVSNSIPPTTSDQNTVMGRQSPSARQSGGKE